MSLLDIKTAGSPVLKEVSQPVKKVDARLRELLSNMAETMYKYEGIGLAAPQVGRSIRAIVLDVGEGLIEMVNPVILASEGSAMDSEGCLSVPGIYGDVERAERLTVEYTTKFGKRKKILAEKLLARCIQHEIDHLNGVLFIDVATALRNDRDDDKGA